MSEISTTNNAIALGHDVKSLMNPSQILEVGKVLRHFIVSNNLSTKIQNRQYAHVDAWKFAGMNFGLTAIPSEPVRISQPKENIYVIFANITRRKEVQGREQVWKEEVPIYQSTLRYGDEEFESLKKRYEITRELVKEYFNYKCSVDIVRISDGKLVATGFATCSNLEKNKVTFDEYAVCSMGQTRAIGKGFRNLLGHVMNAAGVEATPAEEMDHVKDVPHEDVQGDSKPYMSPEQFARTLAGLSEGTVAIDTILKYYALRDAERAAIRKITPIPDEVEVQEEAPAAAKPKAAPKKKKATPKKKVTPKKAK